MASALLGGLIQSGVAAPGDVVAADPYVASTRALSEKLGIGVTESNADAVAKSDVVLLCVKPGDAAAALKSCGDVISGKLLISIVAGLPISTLESLAPGARVIRAMPNTPAQIGAGATAYAPAESARNGDAEIAGKILGAVGLAVAVNEKQLDAVTGLSGSGPAYVFLVIEALSDGGVAAGLPRPLATQLAVQTVLGAARLAAESGEHPALLREAVTSPGGTTAAALATLESAAVRAAFVDAVRAAAKRSEELSK